MKNKNKKSVNAPGWAIGLIIAVILIVLFIFMYLKIQKGTTNKEIIDLGKNITEKIEEKGTRI